MKQNIHFHEIRKTNRSDRITNFKCITENSETDPAPWFFKSMKRWTAFSKCTLDSIYKKSDGMCCMNYLSDDICSLLMNILFITVIDIAVDYSSEKRLLNDIYMLEKEYSMSVCRKKQSIECCIMTGEKYNFVIDKSEGNTGERAIEKRFEHCGITKTFLNQTLGLCAEFWILFKPNQEPQILRSDDISVLIGENDLSTTRYVYPIKYYSGNNILAHYGKEVRRIIKKYKLTEVIGPSFVVLIKNLNRAGTITFFNINIEKMNYWIHTQQIRSGRSLISMCETISIKGKRKGILWKLFKNGGRKENQVCSRGPRHLLESDSIKSLECSTDMKLQKTKNYELESVKRVGDGVYEHLSFSDSSSARSSPGVRKLAVKRSLKYETDLSGAIREIEALRLTIEDSESFVLDYLTRYVKNDCPDDFWELIQMKLKCLQEAQQRRDQFALTLLNRQLKQTTDDLTAAQSNIIVLIEKNRKMELDKLELCNQLEKLEIGGRADSEGVVAGVNQELRRELGLARENVQSLENQLKNYKEDATKAREETHELNIRLQSSSATVRRLKAEHQLEKAVLDKEMSFKQALILDSVEASNRIVGQFRNLGEFLSGVTGKTNYQWNYPNVENNSLLEILTFIGGCTLEIFEIVKRVCSNPGLVPTQRSHEDLRGIQKSLGVATAERDTLEKELRNTKLEVKELLSKMSVMNESNFQLKEKLSESERSNKELENKLLSSQKIHQTQEHSLTEVAEALKKSLESQIEIITREKDQLSKEVCRLEELTVSLREEISLGQSQLERTKLEYETKCMALQAQYTKEAVALDSIHSRIHDQLNRALDDKGMLVEALEKTKRENETLKDELRDYDKELSSLSERIRVLENENASLSKDLVEAGGAEIGWEAAHAQDHALVAALREKLEREEAASNRSASQLSSAKEEILRLKGELEQERRLAQEARDALKRRNKRCYSLTRELDLKSNKLECLEEKLRDAESRMSCRIEDAKGDRARSPQMVTENCQMGYDGETTEKGEEPEGESETSFWPEEEPAKETMRRADSETRPEVEVIEKSRQPDNKHQAEADTEVEEELRAALKRGARLTNKLVHAFKLNSTIKPRTDTELDVNASPDSMQPLSKQHICNKKLLDEYKLLMNRYEAEKKDLKSLVAEKDRILQETGSNLEKTREELRLAHIQLEKYLSTISFLKQEMRNERSKLLQEVNYLSRDKLKTERSLSEVMDQNKCLEEDHENLCEKMLRAVKVIIDGKMAHHKLKDQTSALKLAVKQLNQQKVETEDKLSQLNRKVNEAQTVIAKLEGEKKNLAQNLSDTISKQTCQQSIKRLERNMAELKKQHRKERMELEDVLASRQDALEFKEKCIVNMQERLRNTAKELENCREELLRHKQSERKLKNYILSLQSEKQDMLFSMKDIENLKLMKDLTKAINNQSNETSNKNELNVHQGTTVKEIIINRPLLSGRSWNNLHEIRMNHEIGDNNVNKHI